MGVEHRRAGEIEVGDRLRSILAELRALDTSRRRGRNGTDNDGDTLELDVDLVADVEQAMKVQLPNELLAVLASHVGFLENDWAMTLARIAEHTDRARDLSCPKPFVAVARDPSGGHVFVCVRRRDEGGSDEIPLIVVDTKERTQSPVPLWLWVREQVDNLLDDLALSETEAADVLQAGKRAVQDPDSFRLKLVRRPKPRTEKVRRVRHKLFGEGTVLREIDAGAQRKLEVDFPGVGKKLLLERFVEQA